MYEDEIIDKDNKGFYSNIATDYVDNDIEMLFVYVGGYKVFKNAKKINLNAQYNFDYNEDTNELKITFNDHFAHIFNENINLKVLCGENGTGKTTLIKLLAGKKTDFSSSFFVVLRDKQGNYYANNANLKIIEETAEKKIFTLDKGLPKWSHIHLDNLHVTHYEPLPIGDIYIQEKQIFDTIFKTELFTDYNIWFYGFNEEISRIKRKLLSIFDIREEELGLADIEMKRYFKIYPLQYILFDRLSDTLLMDFCNFVRDNVKSKFSNITEMIEYIVNLYWQANDPKELEDLNNKIRSFIYTEKYVKKLISKNTTIVKHSNGSFSFKEENYQKNISHKIGNELYPAEFKDALKKVGKLIQNSPFCRGRCSSFDYLHNSLFEIIPFNKKSGIKMFNLSAGEQERFEITGNLIRKIRQVENNANLFEDDVCSFAHPNWSRNFIYDYIGILEQLKKLYNIEDKMTNIIISTHSPFIISDVSKYHVEYLQKDESENAVNKDTFAGNIGQMFNDTFFMQSTIGKYSEELLKDIIHYIETGEALNERIKDKVECEKIINAIGDKILKSLLMEKFKNSERYNNNETN